ncbi:MAG: cytochrome P450 [Polyangiaceae bacterium]|nr:cytochrome P450 [Polyangiaceae bacterium]
MNDGQSFLLYGREFKADPYPVYKRLREQGPVHRVTFPSGVSGWLVTGYEAAQLALEDARLGKNHALGNDAWRALAAIMPEPQHSLLQAHLLHQDPPRHTAMRRPIAHALAPRQVARQRARIEQIAEALLDDLAPSSRVDLVDAFAARFSFAVLSEMIGLPPARQREFRRDWCKVVQPVGPRSPLRAAYLERLEGLQGYIDRVIDDKRRHPGDDLLSEMVAAEAAGELGAAELSSTVFQLLVAGQEPVTNQIGMSVITLLSHREQLAELREGSADVARAVEELFRFDGSFELTTWRFFREPTVLHGVEIPAGDSVIVALSAANRDPARFAAPDTLDLHRSPNPHLTFGHGIHFCPGAALGRLEVQVAVSALLRRFPGLKLATSLDEMAWVQAVLTRGVETLPVTLATAA